MYWFFDAIADGLETALGPSSQQGTQGDAPVCPQWVSKRVHNSALFNMDGTRLSPEEADKTSFWRSHHSFGARCSSHANCQQGTLSEQAQAPAYEDWSVKFLLEATCEEPHVLVSVAPRYFPSEGASSSLPPPDAVTEGNSDHLHHQNNINNNNDAMDGSSGSDEMSRTAPTNDLKQKAGCRAFLTAPSAEAQAVYDRRMLETPLIYEEPYTVSVECTKTGVYLWSDHWGLYGKRITEKCMMPPDSGRDTGGNGEATGAATAAAASVDRDVQSRQGLVGLRWRLPTENAAATERPSALLAVSLGTVKEAALQQAMTDRRSSLSEADVVWQQVFETSLVVEDALAETAAFVPFVTLAEAGESAGILQ